ncbi:hypothetical protein HMPREF1246_1427 [Acidaminococcus sp. BV3L6]|nr:hypothetical protein HMPREF1246_1427 [Acidaminococcus sp. BV3L6]
MIKGWRKCEDNVKMDQSKERAMKKRRPHFPMAPGLNDFGQ